MKRSLRTLIVIGLGDIALRAIPGGVGLVVAKRLDVDAYLKKVPNCSVSTDQIIQVLKGSFGRLKIFGYLKILEMMRACQIVILGKPCSKGN